MKSQTRALYRNELRSLLRDRRAVIVSIVLPLLVLPLMMFGSNALTKRQEAKQAGRESTYVVRGSQAAAARDSVTAARARLAAGESETAFRFEEMKIDDPRKAVEEKSLDFLIEGLSAQEAETAKQPAADRRADEGGSEKADEKEREGAPVIRILYRADRSELARPLAALHEALIAVREERRAELLAQRGFAVPLGSVARVVEANVASEGEVAGLQIGRLLTLVLFFFMLTGGSIVAVDALAGEKERGTLETLLTTAVSRADIVTAKFLTVFTVAFLSTLIQGLNLLVWVGLEVIPVPPSFAAAVPPPIVLLLLLLYVPVAGLAAAVLLVISAYARSYKEAQLYFLPTFLLGMTPALVTFLPGLKLRSAIVLVPLANVAMAVKEVLTGVFDWPFIVIGWAVTAGAAAWVIRAAIGTLSNEQLVAAAVVDQASFRRGLPLFERHTLRNFAVLFAVLLIVGNWMGSDADIRLQLFVNLIVLFFGFTLLMLRRYRLDPRQALALRRPRPAVWVAVVLGAPAGILTGVGVFRLASFVVPVPSEAVEEFARVLLPSDVPAWQMILWATVLPGVCEEVAFRGVLLHGLHRRYHPAAVVLLVGLVFGVFHGALFRIAPTAFLGMLFTAVTLLSGSIFPAMLWHTLHNAIGIAGTQAGLTFDHLPIWNYGAGALVLACCLWIVWRARTPYPGLRPWRTGGGIPRRRA